MVNALFVTEFVGYKLKMTQHALRLRMDDALKSLDLTTPQYAVLAQLEVNPGKHLHGLPLSQRKPCMALSLI